MRTLCILLAAAPLAAGAEVYKCETERGIEFTDRPCEGAEVVELEDEQAGLGMTQLESLQAQVRVEEGRLQRARAARARQIAAVRNAELAEFDAEIKRLEQQKSLANNNLAGATYAAGLDQQIAALRQAQGQIIATRGDQIVRGE